MVEVERNVQVVDEHGRVLNDPGRCKFTIRGTRPSPPPGKRPGPDISTKQSRDLAPGEIYMGRYI